MSMLALRPVVESDGELLRRIYASARAEELERMPLSAELKEQFLEMQFRAQAQHYATYPNAQFEIILCDGRPAGRLYVARWESEHRLIDIALLPEFRGHGIGTHFLQQLQSEAAAARKPLTIHVEAFNRARRLYERLGFRLAEDKGMYLLYRWEP